MKTKLLNEIGEALYGPRWQTDLSRDLDIADRTMRRWAAGEGEPSPGAWNDIQKLLKEKGLALRALAARVEPLRDRTAD